MSSRCTVTTADMLWPPYVAVSVACPSDLPTKRPMPSELAMFGSLDVQTADVLTFTEAEVAMQTRRSPATSVGAEQVNVSPVPEEGAVGAFGTPLPHADAIDRIAPRATTRFIGIA